MDDLPDASYELYKHEYQPNAHAKGAGIAHEASIEKPRDTIIVQPSQLLTPEPSPERSPEPEQSPEPLPELENQLPDSSDNLPTTDNLTRDPQMERAESPLTVSADIGNAPILALIPTPLSNQHANSQITP